MPRVSVIIPMYNCEGTLSETVESIINQTYTDWEIILCDDCSTDGTYNIALSYAEKYDRITLLKNETNMRAGHTRNKCVEYAKGEYLAMVDADDMSLPQRFEKQVAYLDEHPEMELVASGMIVFDETGEKLIRGIGEEYPLKKLIRLSVPFMQPTMMIRKAAFEKLGGYIVNEETMRAEDLDLFYRFRLANMNGYVIQEPLVRYHETTDDLYKRSVKAAKGMIKINKKYFKLLNVPKRWNFMIYKPLVSALIPKGIMAFYHKVR